MHVGFEIGQFLFVLFFVFYFFKILIGVLIIIIFILHKTQVIIGLCTVFFGVHHFFKVFIGFLFIAGREISVTFLEGEFFRLLVGQRAFVNFVKILQCLRKFALLKVILRHFDIRLILLRTGWIIFHKLLHQLICIRLVQMNSTIGDVVSAIGGYILFFIVLLNALK